MQAIILAAGMGKRLKDYTKNNTKCMVEVCDETLIERMLKQLDQKNLSRVIVVVGYKGAELKRFIEGLDIRVNVEFVENPDYNKTNNIYSLYLAKDYLCAEDTIFLNRRCWMSCWKIPETPWLWWTVMKAGWTEPV